MSAAEKHNCTECDGEVSGRAFMSPRFCPDGIYCSRDCLNAAIHAVLDTMPKADVIQFPKRGKS